jgi:hypothetical protein
LTANPANGENIEGNVETAAFSGTGASGDCTSNGLGDFKVTTAPANGQGTPWCMKAIPGAAMELQVRGGKCNEAARKITFILDSTSLGLECKYERSTATGPVKGTYNTDIETTEDALGTLSGGANATFVREESSIFCPEKGELDMTFTLETDSTTTEPLYIK